MPTTAERARRALGLAAVLAATSLVLAATAGAQTGPPPSAVDQYVEMVPTAGGPKSPGTGQRAKTALPRAGKDALKHASPETAGTLEEIATSSTYGAPARSTARPRDLGPDREPDTSLPTALESAGALASASVSDTRLVGLLAALFATTLGAVALAIRRARVEAR